MRDETPKHQPTSFSEDTGDVSTMETMETKALQPDDLHNLFEVASPAIDDDPLAAIRHDPNYAALIRDLEYIAAQARLLFQPAEQTPSEAVWAKIQSKLSLDPEDSDDLTDDITDDVNDDIRRREPDDDFGSERALTAG